MLIILCCKKYNLLFCWAQSSDVVWHCGVITRLVSDQQNLILVLILYLWSWSYRLCSCLRELSVYY